MNSAPIPVLSICIPAYGFEEGVRRIFRQLKPDPRLEIIVSEDISARPLDLSDFAQTHNLIHVVNRRPEGAVVNWNRVLSMATGRYVWLLHHDEEPFFPDHLDGLLTRLASPQAPCLLLSHLELNDRLWQRGLRIDSIRRVLLRFPRLILIHNAIGSPSNCIVRRDSALRFDERLKWFVDVEWYYRLLSQCAHTSFSEFSIHSHPYQDSITAGLKSDVFEIGSDEIRMICGSHGFGNFFRSLWKLNILFKKLIKGQ